MRQPKRAAAAASFHHLDRFEFTLVPIVKEEAIRKLFVQQLADRSQFL
jgi:hypothetical protein